MFLDFESHTHTVEGALDASLSTRPIWNNRPFFWRPLPIVSIRPPAIEPARIQLCISDRALNIPMPEIVLKAPGVASFVGELVAGRVPRHMGVNGDLDASVPPERSKHGIHVLSRRRSPTLGNEHMPGVGMLPSQSAQSPKLAA